jgi:hypothetical protein
LPGARPVVVVIIIIITAGLSGAWPVVVIIIIVVSAGLPGAWPVVVIVIIVIVIVIIVVIVIVVIVVIIVLRKGRAGQVVGVVRPDHPVPWDHRNSPESQDTKQDSHAKIPFSLTTLATVAKPQDLALWQNPPHRLRCV